MRSEGFGTGICVAILSRFRYTVCKQIRVRIRKHRKGILRMRRTVLISFFVLLLTFVWVSSGPAEAGKLNLVFIGGDFDTEEGKNNLFRNVLLSHEALREGAEAFFIRPANRDYSNEAAMERTKAAAGFLEDGCLNVVGGYSHGGQSVFFMEMDKVSDLYLIDACVSIRGKCSDPEKNGLVWADWILSTARQGVTVHLFASVGMPTEPSGTKCALAVLKEAAKKDPLLMPLEDGWYCVLDEHGNELGRIETVLLEVNHQTIISVIGEQVSQYLLSKLHDAAC